MTMQANLGLRAGLPGGGSGAPGPSGVPSGVSGEGALASQLPTVTPANVPALPQMGNVTAQIAQANTIATQAKDALSNLQAGGSPFAALANLAGAGVTIAAGQTPSATGQLVRAMVTIGTATASGAAVGGPFGAAAGAIVSGVSAIMQSILGGAPPVFEGLDASSLATPGGNHLYALVYQWGEANPTTTSGYPQGGSFAAYLQVTTPPQKTPRPELLWHLANLSGGSDYGMAAINAGSSQAVGNPMDSSWPVADAARMQAFLAACVAIEPSVLWHWAQPSQGAANNSPGAYAAAYPVWAQPPNTAAWEGDTNQLDPVPASPGHPARPGLSIKQIMASALRRAPDPMFLCSDLYVQNWASAGEDGIFIQNSETLSGLATVYGLLAVGGSSRAIAFELTQQERNLAILNAQAAPPFTLSLHEWMAEGKSEASWKQAKAASTLPAVAPLFRQLVEDYVALANAEATNPNVTMADVCKARRHAPPAYLADILHASGTDSWLGVKVTSPHHHAAPPAPPPTHAAVASAKAKAAVVVEHFVRLYVR